VQTQPDTNYFKFFYKSQISPESVRKCLLQSWSHKTSLPGAMSTSASFYLFAENKKKKKKNLQKLARQWKMKLWQRRSRNFVKRKRS